MAMNDMGSMGSDQTFLKAMIAHHEDALKMSRAYLQQSNPATRLASVSELARSIIKGQSAEIDDMREMMSAADKRAKAGG